MKTAFIAGGNSGIGKAAAKELAKNGYSILILGRDSAKTKLAIEEIKQASGSNSIDGFAADLSTISGMKSAAAEVQKRVQQIDALILSTGVLNSKRILTANGIEYTFAAQYLNRFVLTQLLLPQLKAAGEARIVHVVAPTTKMAQIYFDDLSLSNGYTMLKAAQQSILANFLYAQEFTKRNAGSKLYMNLTHPGIAKTGIGRDFNFFLGFLYKTFATTPEKAARNTIYLASDPEAIFSGYFLNKPSDHSKKIPVQYDEGLAAKLWEKTIEMAGI